jgi:DNA mismatch repair protein MutL
MGRVIVLDDVTANQIAAGEVVERPASVVKELVENSIDANASAVAVEIRNGGISLIRVTDNGDGFYDDDAELAFERFATSKLRNAGDLERVATLGFRGEALPSIAAVSKVRLTTRRPDAEYGRTVEIHGGKLIRSEAAGCPAGTTITVSELFFNVPARYKFLKKDVAETAQISDFIGKIAVGRPSVSFRLISQKSDMLFSPGNGELADAIFAAYGGGISDGHKACPGQRPHTDRRVCGQARDISRQQEFRAVFRQWAHREEQDTVRRCGRGV